jgi:DNA-binding beta-propeller fold protein YncE
MAVLLRPAAARADGTTDPADRLGTFRQQIDLLAGPVDAAFTADGRILIVERDAHHVRVLDADGGPRAVRGTRGSGRGQFLAPEAIAVAPTGAVFVADTGNDRIVVLDDSGNYQREWGRCGDGPGQFRAPCGIAVGQRRVAVADRFNDRVQVFNHAGDWQLTVGGRGIESGEFRRPSSVAFDDRGRLYVAETDNARIQIFDPEGGFIAAWGAWGPYPGLFSDPRGLDFCRGSLFVADRDNHRIQVFGADGTLRYRFGVHAIRPREGAGRLHYPDAVAVSPDGRRAIVCEAFENRCQLFGPFDPEAPPDPLMGAGLDLSTVSHYGPRGDLDGDRLVLIEPESHSVQVFHYGLRDPAMVTRIGGRGEAFGRFIRPEDVCVDARTRRVYVCDAGNRRIEVFRLRQDDPGGVKFDPFMPMLERSVDLAAVLSRWPPYSEDSGPEPVAIDRDGRGSLFVVDQRLGRVLVLDEATLRPMREFELTGDHRGRLRRPFDLAISPDRTRILVVDALQPDAVIFDAFGRYLGALPVASPSGILAANHGGLFVTDQATDRVIVFGPSGQRRAAWGGRGLGAGQMFRPAGILEDDQGHIIVIDHGNHRGQVLTPSGGFLGAFGSRFFTQPALRTGSDQE